MPAWLTVSVPTFAFGLLVLMFPVRSVAGYPTDVVLKIGFLNESDADHAEALLPQFLDAFDYVVLGDGDCSVVNDILKDCASA